MALISSLPAESSPVAPPRGGLWAQLRTALASEAHATSAGLYRGLIRRTAAQPSPGAAQGIWTGLHERADPARYRPQRAAQIVEETLVENGQTRLVLRSPTGRYAQLSPAEAAIWQAMDGTRSVADLATLAFLQFRQLVLAAQLVEALRRDGFLVDPYVGLYASLRSREAQHGVEGWGRRITRILRSHELVIPNIDALAGLLYRSGGRLLFTRAFLVLLALLVFAGAAGFLAARSGVRQYSLLDASRIGPDLLTLWLALLVSFVLHELSHALAVKHFGRSVLRGGVMLYFGMPVAFVDTSDTWLAGRRARIIVSLAGPLCDLAVASSAALAAALLPVGPSGAVAYRLAATAYLAALCNLNPLLELDGYYILSDWLQLPNLRRRALGFIGGPLWQKLRTTTPLNHEERVFAFYGLLAAVYTTLTVILAFGFWRTQLVDLLNTLWARNDLSGRLVAVLILVAVVLPLGLGLLLAAWGLVAAAAAWLARQGYGRNPLVVALALALLALALAALPLRYGVTVETQLIGPLLWMAALAAQLALSADYRGAAVARALRAFLVVGSIEVLAQIGILLAPGQLLAWTALQNLGFTLLLFAGFVALLDTDLRQSSPTELAASALLLVLAFLVAALALELIRSVRPTASPGTLVLLAAPVYTSTVALALLLPLVAGLHDSRLIWSWLLLWAGIATQAAAYLLELLADPELTPTALAALVLAAGLWCAAWCAHLVALRQPPQLGLHWSLDPAAGERERLERAFRRTYAGLYRMILAYAGARRARILDDRMDVLAATANWAITLDREEARIGADLARLPLESLGTRFAEVLRYTVAEIERLAGVGFALRAIRVAYDALPWPEREAADRRCFPHTPWARVLSHTFDDARVARRRLLRQVDRFAACDDVELDTLAAACEPQRLLAGTLIQAPTRPSVGLWIIEAGEVTVSAGPTLLAELHRGAAFGAELGTVDERVYQTSIDSDLLLLRSATLDRLYQGAAPHLADGPNVAATLQIFERVTFFRDLPRETLRRLARQATRLQVPPRTPLIRQGRPNGQLYVIVAGQVAVVRIDPLSPDLPAANAPPPRLIARLGPDEIFGELELLRNSPPMASVLSLTTTDLLSLPHTLVAALIAGGGSATRGLTQMGSGRMHDLQLLPRRT